jgi:hypothetical protein
VERFLGIDGLGGGEATGSVATGASHILAAATTTVPGSGLDERDDLNASDEPISVGIGLIKHSLGVSAARFGLGDLSITVGVRLHHAIGDHLGIASSISAALLRPIAVLALPALLLSSVSTLSGLFRLVSILSEGGCRESGRE